MFPSRPDIYTISPDLPFADTLAEGMIERFQTGHEFALSDCLILVPNRRAVRSVREAFIKVAGRKPILLPSIRAIGDVDEEEMEFLSSDIAFDIASIPPSIRAKERQSLLMVQVERWMKLNQRIDLAPAQSWRLAGELMRFMDQVETEGLSYEGLVDLVAEDFAKHWQITLDFLKIITNFWPAILEEAGQINPAARRDKLMKALIRSWDKKPPKGPVLVAGSTGTIPATRALIKAVLKLEKGWVILPGIDQDMSREAWQSLSAHPSHPQHVMHTLLDSLQLEREDVLEWQGTNDISLKCQLMRDVMLPSSALGEWQNSPWTRDKAQAQAASQGLSVLVCPTRREEATTIALIMRETLEIAGKTAALVTPDRLLATHVKSILKRWDIRVDDSAGDPATISQTGAFLQLFADLFAADFSPITLLAFLQHPFMSMEMLRSDYRQFVRHLDRYVLRGPRPTSGLVGLKKYAAQKTSDKRHPFPKKDYRSLTLFIELVEPIALAFDQGHRFADCLKEFIRVAEKLATSPDQEGADQLWRGDAGEALAIAISDMISECQSLPAYPAFEFAPLLKEMIKRETIRPKFGAHPRLSIWGTMEARLQRTDVMVLGSVNEGTWPAETQADPWMSREMRHLFGLPALDRKIGQSAHDFMQAICADTVYISRAEKVDGSPTVPSRWLLRLEALLGFLPEAKKPYLLWAEQLDQVGTYEPVQPPTPRPPVSARPRELSVTQVETWMRDPYTLYASKILGLSKLDSVDAKPSAADKGTLIHACLERFLKEKGAETGQAGVDRLLSIGREVFSAYLLMPSVYAFWWPRFEQIAGWFVAWQEERRGKINPVAIEERGLVELRGLNFKLKAFADRIDQTIQSDAYEIIDYKTGQPPTPKRVLAGYAPQLPLEGFIIQQGGFPSLKPGRIASLTYIHLKGGLEVAESKRPVKDVEGAILQAEEGLRHLIEIFDQRETPYLASPRADITGYGEYDQLARVKEWQNGLGASLESISREGDENG
ncbi:double-strand break repair protein AddB [Temperatibacter marinus]|uniref:Double-strand break repair protein AddB n=1 Tax=Temperatibacter marinus TaxID=1456591 RepID=A0AA52EIT6_9PROT|nr:double-strand break repair protein AddB [Temperatibacter marinus]WND03933.1 double-strand break repair protein AddB [Temperatibacter marinus]